MSERVDRFGAVASTLCAAHCAVAALLPAVFGAFGLGFLLGHEAEWLFTLVAVGFAAGALIFAWRRHRSVPVLAMLTLGIVGLLASRGIEMSSAHAHEGDAHHAKVEHRVPNEKGAQQDTHARDHGDRHERGHEKDRHDSDGHQKEHDGHQKETHGSAHHDGHDDGVHLAGTGVGVVAGLLLMLGHILNIRTTRRVKQECC